MITIYLPEERIGSDETMARLIDKMTPAARDETEGATLRAEAAICQYTWRDWPHVSWYGSDDTYRQHRCSRETSHRGLCRCRYCGQDARS